ncbi:BamA/TamA family outer membrane protein [uncultured Rikenella sp.]|uniref:BamA/TamA family outer membrane protein n=1 Tax=uncultured Rikenella sp. TaxID=368003 RepID=UPI00261907BE|nr:BamA/TamA family outer membrane protein [uncultured Rikenella sp.]
MFHPRPHIRPRARYLIAPLVLWGLFSAGPLRAQSEPAPPLRDTLAASAADTTLVVAPDSVAARPTGWERFKRFFTESNQVKKQKKFDFSVIGGPFYSNDVQLGLGIVASGLYRMDRRDTLTQPSNVSLFGSVATSGFYIIGIQGSNLFPRDRYRLNYTLYTLSFPSYFWGIGYDMASDKANKSKYTQKQNQLKVDFQFRIADHLYLGPTASINHVDGLRLEQPRLLAGQSPYVTSIGVGFVLNYDTRDVMTNAYKGWYIGLEQYANPKWLGNSGTYGRTDLIVDYYQRLWKGAVLAFDLHTQHNYGDVPWTMMAKMGGSYRMRGYYDGQYRDRNLTEIQIELRQHIYNRHGVAVWVGAGNVYKNFKTFRWSHTLPNYGIGYRWEFKNRVNVRLDYGFGKGQSGFLFQINEAF